MDESADRGTGTADSDQLFRAFFHQSAAGCAQCGLDGRLLMVNDRFCELLGYSREDLLGMTFQDITHPEDLDEDVRNSGRLLAGEIDSHSMEKRYIRKDGKDIWVSIYVGLVRNPEGEPVYFVGIAVDLSQRKAAEKALVESEARAREQAAQLRATMDAVPAAIFVTHDADGRHMTGNRATQDLLGLPEHGNAALPEAAEQARAPFVAVKNGRELLPEELPVQRAARGETIRDYELELRFGDGHRRHLLGHAVPIRDGAGSPTGAVGAFFDITEHKRMEEQFRQAQKLESVGLLAGGIAHDFNNLISVVLGNADLVQQAVTEKNPIYDLVQEISMAASRAAALTRQLLAFARRGSREATNFVLDDLVRGVEKMLTRVIGADIQLALMLGAPGRVICADPGEIEQVIINLAVNARDAMPRGGKLSIETFMVSAILPASLTHARVPAAAATRESIALLIRDTGSGMADDVKARIFEPFFTTKEPGKGTGLGLATVYGITRQAGGSIEVESEPGKGSAFRVLFPCVPSGEGVRELKRTPGMLFGDETILLAEDEASFRKYLRRVLELNGYTVLEAANGREALDRARARAGDIGLLIMDLVMPGMSATELESGFQAICPGTPILPMTGYAENGSHGFSEPALQKPFAAPELLTEIRRRLNSAGGRNR